MLKLTVLCLAIIGIFTLAPASASAYDLLNGGGGGACSNSKASSSAVCAGDRHNKGDDHPITSIISKITGIIAVVAGIIAVIMIIVSGLKFTFSGGDAQKVAGARNTLLHAIIGVAIIALAAAIVSLTVRLI